jgi:hypothetical protein
MTDLITVADTTIEIPKTVRIFFNKKSIDHSRRTPKPIHYYIKLCNKSITTPEGKDLSAWCALIIQEPHDMFNLSNKSGISAYMLSSIETEMNPIQARLTSILELLKWISTNVSPELLHIIDTSLICNDIYIVNLIKEWIPKWATNNFKFGREGQSRPYTDLLKSISEISTKIKLSVQWQSEKSPEMSSLESKLNGMLKDALSTEVDIKS